MIHINKAIHITMTILSTSLLLTTPQYSKEFTINKLPRKVDNFPSPFTEFGRVINPLEQELLNYRNRQLKIQKEREELEKRKLVNNSYKNQLFIVSYYGATFNECGNTHFITASGVPVSEGHIAAPKEIPFGSKVILNGVEYTVTDRGNPKYIKTLSDGSMKIDVFVPRLHGESDSKYEARISDMGINKVMGKLYINERKV